MFVLRGSTLDRRPEIRVQLQLAPACWAGSGRFNGRLHHRIIRGIIRQLRIGLRIRGRRSDSDKSGANLAASLKTVHWRKFFWTSDCVRVLSQYLYTFSSWRMFFKTRTEFHETLRRRSTEQPARLVGRQDAVKFVHVRQRFCHHHLASITFAAFDNCFSK